MKKKLKYVDEPMGKIRVLSDFLPPPDELVFKEETEKVTLSLSRSSMEFFRKQGRTNHVPYQKMIRKVLDLYATRFQG